MQTVKVDTQKVYQVAVTRGYDDFRSQFGGMVKGKRVAVIADANSFSLYGEAVKKLFPDCAQLVIPAGEQEKNGQNYLRLINSLAELGFQRKDCVVTLGGGVVGDLGAFVASTYMRGITLIAMPTTILSMVDSSVGGKTAIDLPYGKNLCGTFYQPNGVYINIDTVKTLPQREVLGGFGEVVKYALLDDRVTLKDLQNGVSEDLIYKCVSIKRDIVVEDEFEGGKRMLLNLGHTVGHAIEKLSSFTLSHGECVVKGLYAAVKASQKLFKLPQDTVEEMVNLIGCMGHDLTIEYDISQIVEAIKADKKSVGEEVSFVLLKGVGKPVIQRIKIADLVGLLA